jgi:hypothetical protein
MVKKLLPFAKDLVGDGYVLVGIFAPLLSIAFTIAKAFDMPELSHLRDAPIYRGFVMRLIEPQEGPWCRFRREARARGRHQHRKHG